jgi:hypothetical protein
VGPFRLTKRQYATKSRQNGSKGCSQIASSFLFEKEKVELRKRKGMVLLEKRHFSHPY